MPCFNGNAQMNQSLVDLLTEGQKQCLRLVGDHLTSKEIARQLGISHFTVDQRLDAARRKMNARSRKEAARVFIALERQFLSEPLVYETEGLDHEAGGDIRKASVNRAGGDIATVIPRFSIPPIGGERHHLPKTKILVQSLNIALFSTLVIALVIIILTGTFRLFH